VVVAVVVVVVVAAAVGVFEKQKGAVP